MSNLFRSMRHTYAVVTAKPYISGEAKLKLKNAFAGVGCYGLDNTNTYVQPIPPEVVEAYGKVVGLSGEDNVDYFLKYLTVDGFHIYHGLTLPNDFIDKNGKKGSEIDFIAVSTKGIFLLEVKTPLPRTDNREIICESGKRDAIENQIQMHHASFRNYFASFSIPESLINNMLVVSCPSKQQPGKVNLASYAGVRFRYFVETVNTLLGRFRMWTNDCIPSETVTGICAQLDMLTVEQASYIANKRTEIENSREKAISDYMMYINRKN